MESDNMDVDFVDMNDCNRNAGPPSVGPHSNKVLVMTVTEFQKLTEPNVNWGRDIEAISIRDETNESNTITTSECDSATHYPNISSLFPPIATTPQYCSMSSYPSVHVDSFSNSSKKPPGRNVHEDSSVAFSSGAFNLESVGGLDSHVEYLKRAVLFPLKHRDALSEWGMDPPKGILFHGPPGTGKTLLAKSLVKDMTTQLEGTNISFFYHKGCESFSQYFGESEENLRALFKKAKENKPSVIFFDEIDGLCPDRETASQQGSEAYVGVVTALLGLIDSVKRGEVFLIGATNRLDAIDPAIRRPGRFDKVLTFPVPNTEGRKKIIQIHTKGWSKDQPSMTHLNYLAAQTQGFTGADLQKLCKDTLDSAILRMGTNTRPQDLSINEQDWRTALDNMNAFNSSVFGSTVHVSHHMLPIYRPLVENIVKEIMVQFQRFIPQSSSSDQKVCQFPSKTGGLRSFVVWGPEFSSESCLSNVIMQEILSSSELNKIPVYILNMENIMRQQNNTSFAQAIKQIVNQGLQSTTPCILYTPTINALHRQISQISEGLGFLFLEYLASLRGSNCLVLATFVGPAVSHDKSLKKLFTGYRNIATVRLPNAEEREGFFRQIFDKLIKNDAHHQTKKIKTLENSEESTARFSRHLMTAVKLTESESCDSIFKLYAALKTKVDQWTAIPIRDNGTENVGIKDIKEDINCDELNGEFSKLFDEYELNGLRD